MACRTSSRPTRSHPKAVKAYKAYLVNLAESPSEGEDRVSGKPSAIAIVAAREKLSTDVTETTVDARQSVNAFKSI